MGKHRVENAPPFVAEAGGYEIAERITGLCRGTLYSLVHEGRIPHIRLSPRLVRFRRADLERWMAERTIPAKR